MPDVDLRDDASIRRVIAMYCQAVDDGRFDDLVALFSEDGTFQYGPDDVQGHENLKAWFAERQPPERRGKHLTTNVVIDCAGDVASAVSDFVVLVYVGGQLTPTIAGRYSDDLRRYGGRWLIHTRRTEVMSPPA